MPILPSDFDLFPMTLILKLDLDIVNMSHHVKNEVNSSRHSKVIARMDRQTFRQYVNITFPHTRAVVIDFWLTYLWLLTGSIGVTVLKSQAHFNSQNWPTTFTGSVQVLQVAMRSPACIKIPRKNCQKQDIRCVWDPLLCMIAGAFLLKWK